MVRKGRKVKKFCLLLTGYTQNPITRTEYQAGTVEGVSIRGQVENKKLPTFQYPNKGAKENKVIYHIYTLTVSER